MASSTLFGPAAPEDVKNLPTSNTVTANRCVKVGSTRGQVEDAGSGDIPIGVAIEGQSTSGDRVHFAYRGFAELQVDGSGTNIAAGDKLKPDANGKGVKTTTGGDDIIGTAYEASTSDGDLISVLVMPTTL